MLLWLQGTVENTMLKRAHNDSSPRSQNANEIRRRIDARTAAFRQKYGEIALYPMKNQVFQKPSSVPILDPASKCPLTFEPRNVAEALGANLDISRQRK